MARLIATVAATLATAGVAQQGRGAQKMDAPKWLDEEGKELFYDIENEELKNMFSDTTCEFREKLLRKMMGKGDGQEAGQHRARVLQGLGLCRMKKGEFGVAQRRFESSISELGVPSEDVLLQNANSAHIVLVKQAAAFLAKNELTQAGTALRRCHEVFGRYLKKLLKMVHKQMGQQGQAPPLEALIEELSGYGKSGDYLPQIVQQVPPLKQELPFAEIVEHVLNELDTRLATIDTTMKAKKIRLQSKGKTGSLLYVRGLPTLEAVPTTENFAAAQELVSGGATKALVEEAAALEKGATLIKRSAEEKGCKGKGLDKTCEAILKIADISSNGFGDTRVIVVKGKKPLDACTTNANLGILVAAKDGAELTVAGAEGSTPLKAGEPVVVDFCREASVETTESVPILFAQAWHPEFAAVERTTELRARAKSFGLGEEAVKAAAKVVNDAAKKGWEKSNALWRKSEGHSSIKAKLDNEEATKMRKEEEANDSKRKEDEANSEERKKNLEELQKKREAKAAKAKELEEKRARQKRIMEEERAAKDPWLRDPTVIEVEKNIEEMKTERRDANAKLEFDLSTQLTKDISAAERKLKKTIKKARKAYKKSVKNGGVAAEKTEEKTEEKAGGESSELADLKARLTEVSKAKSEAADKEDFKTAKKLKAEAKDLEAKIKKLEL